MSNVERDLNFIRLMIYQFYKCRTEYRVSRIVAKYGMEFDDVFQIGCIAYLGAEKSYKDDKGVKFHTFAGHCIKSHLKRIIRDHTLQKRDTTQLSFVSLDDIEIPTEGDFEKVEMKMLLNRLLELSTVEERYLVVANYTSLKSQTKIGKIVGIKQITVSRRVIKAVAKMHEVAVRRS